MLRIPGTGQTGYEYNWNVRDNLNPSRHRERLCLSPRAVALRHVPEQRYSAVQMIRRRRRVVGGGNPVSECAVVTKFRHSFQPVGFIWQTSGLATVERAAMATTTAR